MPCKKRGPPTKTMSLKASRNIPFYSLLSLESLSLLTGVTASTPFSIVRAVASLGCGPASQNHCLAHWSSSERRSFGELVGCDSSSCLLNLLGSSKYFCCQPSSLFRYICWLMVCAGQQGLASVCGSVCLLSSCHKTFQLEQVQRAVGI